VNRTDWLNRLQALHARRRAGETLAAEEAAWYRAARLDLLDSAVVAQNRPRPGAVRARSSIRLVRAVPVLLEATGWSPQTMTADLGTGGFAVLLDRPPPAAERMRATLVIPGDGPAAANVAVAGAHAEGGLVRVSFTFADGSELVRARVEDFILDSVLEQLVFWDDVLRRLEP
jgi:hypothetical protein